MLNAAGMFVAGMIAGAATVAVLLARCRARWVEIPPPPVDRRTAERARVARWN